MKRLLCLIALPIVQVGCRESKGEPREHTPLATAMPQLQGTSTFHFSPDANGCPTTHSVNTRFSFIQDTGLTGTVLREKFDVSQCLTAEASTSTVTVSAWRAGRDGSERPVFEFKAPGERGAIVDETLYRITERGCCGPSDLDRYFSLVGGREVFAASTGPLKIRVAGQGNRWLAVMDSYSATAIPESERDSTIIGLIQYGTTLAPLQRLAVVHPGGGFFGIDSLYFLRGGIRSASTEILVARERDDSRPIQVSGFSIVAVFVAREWDAKPLRIEIPVENDRLQVERARLSAHIRLRVVTSGT